MTLLARLSLVLTTLAVLVVTGPAPGGLVQAAPPPTVLTATVGPRQTPWTRSFNPFLSDAESRWPTWAGIYEPLVITNRATGLFTPWLATAHAWSPDNLKLRFTLRPGVV